MIDTNADSKEDLLAAKQLLESVLAKRGVTSSNQTTSSDDRLQRKLAKAQAKQESAAPAMDMFGSNPTQSQSESQPESEAVPVMDMFGSSEPSSNTDYSETRETDEDDENSNIRILPY